MTSMDMVEAIMAGAMTVDGVKRWNVERMDRWFTSPGHPADGCRNKNCVHGPRPADVTHRNTVADEVGMGPTSVEV